MKKVSKWVVGLAAGGFVAYHVYDIAMSYAYPEYYRTLSRSETIDIFKDIRKEFNFVFTGIALESRKIQSQSNTLSDSEIQKMFEMNPVYRLMTAQIQETTLLKHNIAPRRFYKAIKYEHQDDDEIHAITLSINRNLQNAYKGLIPPLIGKIPEHFNKTLALSLLEDTLEVETLAKYEALERLKSEGKIDWNNPKFIVKYEIMVAQNAYEPLQRLLVKYNLNKIEDHPMHLFEVMHEYYAKTDLMYDLELIKIKKKHNDRIQKIINGDYTREEADNLRLQIAKLPLALEKTLSKLE